MSKTSESNMIEEVSNALVSSRLIYEFTRNRIIAIHGYCTFRKIQCKAFAQIFGHYYDSEDS